MFLLSIGVLRGMVWLPVALLLACVLTRVITGLRYHYRLRRLQSSAKGGSRVVVDAPALPYWIPGLCHAPLMIIRKPGGQFWRTLLANHPRDAGICTLSAGGKSMHLLWNVPAINAMFKTRTTINKGEFDRDLWTKAFALPSEHYDSMQQNHHIFHDYNSKLLMRRNAVDELTTLFVEQLIKNFESRPSQVKAANLYNFFRVSMFEASVDTSFGTKLREKFYPNMIGDFDKYDADMPSFYYGLPRFMAPAMYSNREKILERMKAWNESNRTLQSEKTADPEAQGPWSPDHGTKYNRARHAASAQVGWSVEADAAADMAFLMGLSSNVMRTTGWMLLHVVGSTDTTLLPRIMQEIEKSRVDGQKVLDVDKLVTSPLLQSLWTEALRVYVDNYTARNIIRDMELPMDEEGEKFIRLKAGDTIFAANYPVQTDPAVWGDDAFRAERFVTTDANGVSSFQLTSRAGKIFPFGGGPEKCPGRIFAKQEAIAALALFLSYFDVQRIGMVDGDGKETDRFPSTAPMVAGGGAHLPEGDIRVNITKRL